MKLTYISFIGLEELPFYGENFRSFLVPVSIFNSGFLDDALEHKLLLNHMLLIFKNYLHLLVLG